MLTLIESWRCEFNYTGRRYRAWTLNTLNSSEELAQSTGGKEGEAWGGSRVTSYYAPSRSRLGWLSCGAKRSHDPQGVVGNNQPRHYTSGPGRAQSVNTTADRTGIRPKWSEATYGSAVSRLLGLNKRRGLNDLLFQTFLLRRIRQFSQQE